MKILVVTALPSGEQSRTKKLLDAFVDNIKDRKQLEFLNLLEDRPDFVTPEILEAYKLRNYQGKELTKKQKESISKFDRMTKQFTSADIVVMAFPMYNFSLPGIIKTYFDSVMLKGETFDTDPEGFVGLMAGKRALVLMSSGGKYSGENSSYDYATTLVGLEFDFMGFSDVRIILAQGLDMKTTDVKKIVSQAQDEVKKVIKAWKL